MIVYIFITNTQTQFEFVWWNPSDFVIVTERKCDFSMSMNPWILLTLAICWPYVHRERIYIWSWKFPSWNLVAFAITSICPVAYYVFYKWIPRLIVNYQAGISSSSFFFWGKFLVQVVLRNCKTPILSKLHTKYWREKIMYKQAYSPAKTN